MVLAGPPSDKRPALALDWESSLLFSNLTLKERERGKRKARMPLSKQGCQLRKEGFCSCLLVGGCRQHKNCLKSVVNTGIELW